MASSRDRTASAEPLPRRTTLAVDVVPLTPWAGELAALVVQTGSGGGAGARGRVRRDRWTLPWDGPHDGESLDDAAQRVTRSALGAGAIVEQIGAFGGGAARRHPGEAEVSVGYVALVPLGGLTIEAGEVEERQWFPLSTLPPLPARQRVVVDGAARFVRNRVDQSPLAFRLLPPTFTLSELQGIYELLLGHRLHKASFRRALQAAELVEPTEEWRSEGRGRPAQLFRYGPAPRSDGRRGPRFDFDVE